MNITRASASRLTDAALVLSSTYLSCRVSKPGFKAAPSAGKDQIQYFLFGSCMKSKSSRGIESRSIAMAASLIMRRRLSLDRPLGVDSCCMVSSTGLCVVPLLYLADETSHGNKATKTWVFCESCRKRSGTRRNLQRESNDELKIKSRASSAPSNDSGRTATFAFCQQRPLAKKLRLTCR